MSMIYGGVGSGNVTTVDVGDLKKALSSGNTLVVQCNDQVKHVMAPLEDLATECSKTDTCAVGVMDCSKKLAKRKKDIYARFGLPKSKKKDPKYPTVFVMAKGKSPVEVPTTILSGKKSSAKLLEFVQKKSKVGVVKLKNSGGLRKHCLSSAFCVLLVAPGKPSPEHRNVVRKLMKKHRTVQFAVVASKQQSPLQLKLSPEPEGFLAMTPSSDSPQWILFKRLSRASKSTKRLKSGAVVYDGAASALDGMGDWLQRMKKASPEEFQLLKKSPILRNPTAKPKLKKKKKPKKKKTPAAPETPKPKPPTTLSAAELAEEAEERQRRERERRDAMEAEMAANTPEYVDEAEDEEGDEEEDEEEEDDDEEEESDEYDEDEGDEDEIDFDDEDDADYDDDDEEEEAIELFDE